MQARAYVSVLGGNAVLASYFAAVNIVYAVEGSEVKNSWEYGELYGKLGGGHVLRAGSYTQLLQLARENLIPAAAGLA